MDIFPNGYFDQFEYSKANTKNHSKVELLILQRLGTNSDLIGVSFHPQAYSRIPPFAALLANPLGPWILCAPSGGTLLPEIWIAGFL